MNNADNLAHFSLYYAFNGCDSRSCVDLDDNELAYLETIHLFVEMLDMYFGNVCELDLVL